jgi:hypothetical protein
MGTSAYATYKCNMYNKPLQHVEKPRETCVACTLKQTQETLVTWPWNKHYNYSDFYVSMHVKPTLLCNLCMVYMFGLYNTLNTLRTLNGTMFMLIILPKCASKWWLTMYEPYNTFVWPFQKWDLEALYDCVPFYKVVENFIRNKLCLRVKSWKCVEHAQKGPTSQIEGCFQHLVYSKSLIGSIKSTCSWHFIFQFHMVAQLGSLIGVGVLFMRETMDQVSSHMKYVWISKISG